MSRQLSTLADRKTSWSPGGARAQPAFLSQKTEDRRLAGEWSELGAPTSAAGGCDFGRISVHAPPRADATGNSGEFAAACTAQVQTKLAISQSGDEFEQEADRVADTVMSGRSASVSQSSIAPSVQREEPQTGPPTEKPKSEEEKYKEAAKKLAEALRATEAGKQLEARVTELGKDFLSTTEGKAVAATALAAALAGIIATNSELPVQVPEIPLDWLAPGLKAKLTWEGPVRTPTNVGLTLTTGGGVSIGASYAKTPAAPGKPAEEKAGLTITIPLGGSSSKKSGPSESEKIRAETARLTAENAKWQEAFKTPEQRAEDQAFWDAYWRSKMNDPLNPRARQGPGLQPTPGATEPREKDDLMLMREPAGEYTAGAFAPPVVHEVLTESGQPLDADTRGFMESRLGHDFSRVRIHTGATAAESARAVNALAYTVGRDVVFDTGQYAPQMTGGKRLLAHELAHVVQQTGGFLGNVATRSTRASQVNGRGSREVDQMVASVPSLAHCLVRATVRQRVNVPFVARQNTSETAAVLHTGTVRGSGLQFFPLQVVSTHIGPVSGAGGLLEDSRNRLSVVVGQSMTLRRIANLILPLWNSATPFTPAGAAGPIITLPVSADVLARGLLVYNRYYLRLQTQPVPSITGWQGGLRFPLPVEIDANGEGAVNKDLIQNLAADFDNAWEALLDQPAGTVAAPAPADLRQTVADFLISHPSANERGVALAARAITNPVEAQPLLAEILAQLGVNAFDVALAFMDASVNPQIALLASQRSGAGVLGAIRAALAAAPATLTASQQASLARANRMLGLITTIVPRDMPFLQPTAVSAAGEKSRRSVLTYDQVKALVEANNKASVSTELLLCLIWKESGFNPSVKNASSSATGLMQMTKGAVDEANKNTPKGVHYEHSEMTDPATNIQCGTYYLAIRIKWAKGNLKGGLEGFGTGSGYADKILACETCLTKKPDDAMTCLHQIHP